MVEKGVTVLVSNHRLGGLVLTRVTTQSVCKLRGWSVEGPTQGIVELVPVQFQINNLPFRPCRVRLLPFVTQGVDSLVRVSSLFPVVTSTGRARRERVLLTKLQRWSHMGWRAAE